jgi:hypothetical protein
MVSVSIDDAQALTFLRLLVITDKTELSFYFVNFCFNLDFFVYVSAYNHDFGYNMNLYGIQICITYEFIE